MLSSLRFRLAPPELEAEFRSEGLAWDSRRAAVLAGVAVVFILATLPTTFVLGETPSQLHQVWGIRAIVVLAAVAAIIVMRGVSAFPTYDAAVTAWIAIWFAGIVSENALLPAGATTFVIWDVFITVAVYAAIPLPLGRQAALAAMLSAGDLLVLWRLKTPSEPVDFLDVSLAFLAANLVGAFVSRDLHSWRRHAFVTLGREVALRTQLEAALGEVKTLQGIIPICSFCKNVRTDVGDWQQVEAYVRDRSDAKFSHGICPKCMAIHFPG